VQKCFTKIFSIHTEKKNISGKCLFIEILPVKIARVTQAFKKRKKNAALPFISPDFCRANSRTEASPRLAKMVGK
jgi:hypothetical protein